MGATQSNQMSRPRALWGEDGATIVACRGDPPDGAVHKQALVVDRRYLYSGGANFTNKSVRSGELVYRMVGLPVAGVLADLAVSMGQRGLEWDGHR